MLFKPNEIHAKINENLMTNIGDKNPGVRNNHQHGNLPKRRFCKFVRFQISCGREVIALRAWKFMNESIKISAHQQIDFKESWT